jgi:hypothetical protein
VVDWSACRSQRGGGEPEPILSPKPSALRPILSILEPLFFSFGVVLPPLISPVHHGERGGRERSSVATRELAEGGAGSRRVLGPTGSGERGSRAAATYGVSTRLVVTLMEGKGPTGACRKERHGGLVDWGDGGHPGFSD